MKRFIFTFLCLFVFFTLSAQQQRPNIVIILADDLGYNEVGAYGQRLIETPNMDYLAANGLKFTNHYAGAPVCAPSRCVLLTGKHTGHAYVRGNDEWNERGNVWSAVAMLENPRLEGQRPLPAAEITMAEVLQQAGYKTGIFGKWGLGAPESEGIPGRQGFNEFYGYNCQRQAHSLYPAFLWENDHRDYLSNKFVAPNTGLAPNANPNDPAAYADYQLEEYAPTLIHEKALKFIDNNADKPFFLYYASPLPHVPLQAPQRWVEHYQKKFGPETPYAKGGYFPNFTPKATYAAMISYLDEQVGDIVSKLKQKGLLENTIILFTSDNGPTWAGGAPTTYFESASPFQTVTGRTKASVYEGGLRVPLIAYCPGTIPVGTSDYVSSFYDYLPTITDLLGLNSLPTDGISFKNVLLGKPQTQSHDFLYWEFPENTGSQALLQGNWKLIRRDLKKDTVITELYDLSKDITESTNLANNYPEKVQEMLAIMQQAHTPPAVPRFEMKALDGQNGR